MAIVDIQLLDGQRGVAAGRLEALNVPFIMHSGYNPAFQAPVFHDAPYLSKPAAIPDLVKLANQITCRTVGDDPPPPSGGGAATRTNSVFLRNIGDDCQF
ncbi:hypothetical protein ACVDG5_000100 [Mesorhizobium sp. ORM6]